MKEIWSGGWNNYYRYTYTYNNQGQKIAETYEIWFSTEWRNASRWTYNYDGNDLCILLQIDIWENEEWHPYSKEDYEYDVFLRLIRNSSSMYSENDWLYQSMYSYHYDDYSNLTSRSFFTWNDNQWMNYERWIFTYDSLGNSLTGAHNSWTETGWVITEGVLDVYENGVWATSVTYCSNYQAHFGNLYTKLEEPLPDFTSIVNIYPNPVHDQFTVNFPSGSETVFQYHIYDIKGILVISGTSTLQNSAVDVRMLPLGMYLLSITKLMLLSLIRALFHNAIKGNLHLILHCFHICRKNPYLCTPVSNA
ncbi:MAG: T9SS type A sorting domain-containing protein [Bacteroidales bacterium]|nr:T9SS type A sorting domain-containing protein [Bacteroidales bacterium]